MDSLVGFMGSLVGFTDSQGRTQTVDMAIVNLSHVLEDLVHKASKSMTSSNNSWLAVKSRSRSG